MAIIAEIAEAVAAALNDGSFSQSFTAERAYLPVYELSELKETRVTVVPKGVAILPGSRSRNQYDYAIDIAVQKKLSRADNAEIDSLLALAEEIADFFRLRRLPGFPEAMWLKTANEPVYAQEHLDQLRQFTGLLTVTFRVVR